MKRVVVNRSDLKNNVRHLISEMKEDNPDRVVIGIVKDNGYGLGIVNFTRIIHECGINDVAVATMEEVEILVKEDIGPNILMLSPTNNNTEIAYLISNGVEITVDTLYQFNLVKETAKALNKSAKIHLKIDCGFGRYGFMYDDFESVEKCFKENIFPIEIIGIYAHGITPVSEDYATLQFDRFMKLIDFIEGKGYEVPLKHVCSSSGALKYKDMRLDAVRLGSCLTGRTICDRKYLKKVGVFETEISEIRNIKKGESISYGREYTAKKDMRIGIIQVGYADGFTVDNKKNLDTFSKKFKNVLISIRDLFKDKGLHVVINGTKYPIIGRVGMYHSIIDIDKNPNINLGDIVRFDDFEPLKVNPIIRREYV
ncbi:MAG: alanine racemase [Clostridia bacterium]|nr:alanine racemase [Clostridia bacterium]